MKKRRTIGIAKNFLIIGLVVLCIFQVSSLWFGDDGISELFGGIFANRTDEITVDDALNKLTTPFRIISSTTDEQRYRVIYNGIPNSPEKLAGHNAITAALTANSAPHSSAYNPNLAVTIIYEYAVPIPAGVFDQRFGHTISNRISAIDAIYFVTENAQVTVVFADRTAEIMLHYSINNYAAYSALIAVANSPTGSFYHARIDGAFVPQWLTAWHTFNTVLVTRNFTQNLPSVGTHVRPFFDRPNAMLMQMSIDVFLEPENLITQYRFSADQVVVRYYPTIHVLEYANHSTTIPNEILNSFTHSFALALNVVNRDPMLQNEVFFAGYTRSATGFTFYFDAAVNNFPVTFHSDLVRATGMKHFIEVTISSNRVLYRRYAFTFQTQDNIASATIDFNHLISILLMYGQTITIEDKRSLRFGYMAILPQSDMILHWHVGAVDVGAVE